ncbi:MAG: toll/interleukin-1 receptor domain-containing protein [Bacteroidetes bacterium]|nr:toll/interleukin-1 receptor domain-containing protein [Bacteroidota bacterium]
MSYNWNIREIAGKDTEIKAEEIRELSWRTLASLLEDFEKHIDRMPQDEIDFNPEGELFGPVLTKACLHAAFDFYDLDEMNDLSKDTLKARKSNMFYIMAIEIWNEMIGKEFSPKSSSLKIEEQKAQLGYQIHKLLFSYRSKPAYSITSDPNTLTKRKLRVFLCHSSDDKNEVRKLYDRLSEHNVEPWIDEKNLLPGCDWQLEISRAIRNSDMVVVCLTKKSITKIGYVQKEIKYTLDFSDEHPEGSIFIVPAKLEDVEVPGRLNRWQWVNLYKENGYQQLVRSMRQKATELGLSFPKNETADNGNEA